MFSSSLLNVQTVLVVPVVMQPCNNSSFQKHAALLNNSESFLLFSDCGITSGVCAQAGVFFLQRCVQNCSAFGAIQMLTASSGSAVRPSVIPSTFLGFKGILQQNCVFLFLRKLNSSHVYGNNWDYGDTQMCILFL